MQRGIVRKVLVVLVEKTVHKQCKMVVGICIFGTLPQAHRHGLRSLRIWPVAKYAPQIANTNNRVKI